MVTACDDTVQYVFSQLRLMTELQWKMYNKHKVVNSSKLLPHTNKKLPGADVI